MGLQLITDSKNVTVYRKDKQTSNGGTFATYCVKVSSKKQDDTWVSAFIDVVFRKGVEVNNKAVISIKNSFPVINEYNGKTYIKWMIMDFDVIEQGEGQTVAPTPNGDGFMTIPSGLEDEGLPFS